MRTEELVSSAPGAPTCETHQDGCCQTLSYTPASVLLWLYLLLLQRPFCWTLPWPKPYQPSKSDLFPSSPKPLHAPREESSPTGVIQNISIFSCFGLVIFFLWQGCFLTLPNPIPTACVSKGQHSLETLSLPSRPLRYLFIFLPHKKMQQVAFANIK